ncbi:unnamed protein product [Dovyalis caffra]|uniref:Uncharacterized protein n=1 Tax=Dovyalis caffra TaxID=77055 RepID=A0AAV1SHV7_9ROSI|nr:unnamed protein product [Dovyalis caffra]
MVCGVLTFRVPLSSSSTFTSNSKRLKIQCSNSSPDVPLTAARLSLFPLGADFSYGFMTEKIPNDFYMTGGAYDFDRGTKSLTQKLLPSSKKVTIVRHGLSSWNEESRVQGSSNLSVLTETGVKQAERCRKALANMYFDQCFSSPISRAKSTAEVIWQGREEPLVFLDSLKEAHLFFLEGMKNGLSLLLNHIQNLEAVDAREKYPKEYTTWREDPANFNVNGIYPLRNLWGTAREAWKEILLSPEENSADRNRIPETVIQCSWNDNE